MKHLLTLWKKSFFKFLLTLQLAALFILFFTVQVSATYGLQAVVTGKVTAENDSALSGVSVQIKGTNRGTTTNAQGVYSLTASDNDVLVFSYVGYETQELAVGGKTQINVSLVAAKTNLEQVVVIGYGTANKRDLTGSITKVVGKDIADKPNTNPVQALQGKVAGVYIVNSGKPGDAPDVRIRGTNSINGYKPLYVVDGIFNDDISYVNPADIESIEILKDPSSLAIFGLRGANGVILITTKRAKAGQMLVNLSSSNGFREVTDKAELTNAEEFKTLYEEQRQTEASDQGNTYSPFDFSKWTANTDWQDELFQKAFFSYNNVSITGSTDKNKFYMSLGYNTEEGVVRNETLKKAIFTVNDELKVSNALKFGFNVSGYKADLPRIHEISAALRAAPVAPTFNESNGLFYEMPSFQAAQVANPLVDVDYNKGTDIHNEYRTIASIFGQVNFLKAFEFKASYYIDFDYIGERTYSPITVQYNPVLDHADTTVRTTKLTQTKQTNIKFQQDYLLTYKKKFGDHNLTLLGGFTTLYQTFDWSGTSVQGIQNQIPWDKNKWYVTGDVGDKSTLTSTLPTIEGDTYPWNSFNPAILFRALYNYRNKYLLNGSFRRDGSSAFFANGNAWKNFGSVGAAWVVSDENFLKDSKAIDYLKVKGSWGILGNQFTDPRYRYPLYSALNSTPGIFGNNIISGYSAAYRIDPNLHWENVRSYEAGFELNTFARRLHVEANYYHKLTKDLIVQKPGLDAAGIPPGIFNAGSISNKGFEFLATWTQNIGKDFSFTVSANLTTIKNNVVSLADAGYQLISTNSVTQAGYPIGYFYGYVEQGIYQSQEDIDKSPPLSGYTLRPGDIKYADLNGDNVVDTKDRTMIGNPTPKGIYGASISLKYKGFDFSTDVMGVYGNQIFRRWDRATYTVPNYAAFELNRWHGEGTSDRVPILANTRQNNFLPSTFNIEDGDFFRIRNMQLGYNVNTRALNRVHIKSLRIYANVQNLKTFKNTTGFSPEVGGSAIEFGVDNGTYPLPASYSIGINLSF
jgi:TonB-linked SusC/RagA family outer membrane protein